ncbi:hypothetical protein AB4Y44_16170 [Paraburkholderia sp. BR10937]|uniref:hypothetical protein n=1 Tax=Paraburkholderia sp. BR10937 TaxID=3236994 RepID=UPI0034D214F6
MHTASPSRHFDPMRRQRITVWIALFAVPLIWLLYLLICITLVSSACVIGVAQRGELRWDDTENILAAVSAAAFAVCLVLAVATGRAWRKIAWSSHGEQDAACFIAWCSAIVATAFTVTLGFIACVLIAAPFDRLCAPFQ